MDLSILEKYFIDLDDIEIRMLEHHIKIHGVVDWFWKIYNCIDCTKYFPNSDIRTMQTLGYLYKKHISELKYIIDELKKQTEDDEFINDLWNKVINRHIHNIEYEKENPPFWCFGKVKSKLAKHNVSKKSKNVTESVAERKLKTKIARLNTLTFNIKAIK